MNERRVDTKTPPLVLAVIAFELVAIAFGFYALSFRDASSKWVTVINTGFEGIEGTAATGVLPKPWTAYNFPNSRPNGGYYLPSHCVIRNGVLSLVQSYEPTGPAMDQDFYELDGGGWYQCAITTDSSNTAGHSIDHRVTLRLRIVADRFAGVTSHRNMPLWWPTSGNWPVDGEENFFENDGSLAQTAGVFHAFFHYGRDNERIQLPYPAFNVTQWHTYTQERRNHRIRIWIDGAIVIDRQLLPTELPDTVKQPVFQQENPSAGPPSGKSGQEEIQIDWVVIERPLDERTPGLDAR